MVDKSNLKAGSLGGVFQAVSHPHRIGLDRTYSEHGKPLELLQLGD